MKIRRSIEIIPTLILLAISIYSLVLRANGGVWNTYFVIGVTGLSVYIPVALFIEALANSSHKIEKNTHKNKTFYSCMIALWIISLIFAVLMMEQVK
ncbi:LasU family protein [Companilactobacillus nuruki]|uniref:Uncharacterized protein n=1 Tax=Companilactobacillus nuruki TaxID=1993540 RepID=A0A2N7AVH7_9LACO|nr:LasU family protein [Companilactobacillus nuruki]PMD72165.1 hypothetical protein CBP76_04210 [Companilactobacillus nuruki]